MRERVTVEDWSTVPRKEMLGRVIVALDCARGEAEAAGDHHHARHLWDELVPFVESELARLLLAEADVVFVLMHPEGWVYTWGDSESEANLRVHLDVDDAKATADASGLEVFVLTVDSLREHLANEWAHVTNLVVTPAPIGSFRLDYGLDKSAYVLEA